MVEHSPKILASEEKATTTATTTTFLCKPSFAYQLSKENKMDNKISLTPQLRPGILSAFLSNRVMHQFFKSNFKSILLKTVF